MNTNEVEKLYTRKASFYQFFFLDFLGVHRRIKKFFRQSSYIRPQLKILDAGCGTGNITRALYTIAHKKGYEKIIFHAFDLTQRMLDLFQQWIQQVKATNITLTQANVLNLEQLPSDWNNYDLIVSCGMLEYLSKDEMKKTLYDLKKLLKFDGSLIIFITKHNIITKFLIEWWWKAHIYSKEDCQYIFANLGFNEFKITTAWWRFILTVEAKLDRL
ncbi:MAG: hypothetical protein A2586_00020 [Candidatus Harrisonbacteria bacterium RIFOXYD1_FULL_40_9]|uniref:Methyltransferase domain-containing protein n=1 Tax=Candidatus Harrisonbacteria bacterium RIFOXYD1_FULL_40_9 TaxID=1798412 RepID=A0A1G1ZWL8_9BACT|nr:MAG: hypothetical protein A2586_00020 [Candidatus Harrisonbacteria bacterium RIFOXYD1_FULL_40_9]